MRITGPDYATVGVAIVTAPEDYKGAGTGYAVPAPESLAPRCPEHDGDEQRRRDHDD